MLSADTTFALCSPGINISESPTFLAQPDYPIPPAFEQPTAAPPVARMEDFGQRTLGMQNFSGGAIGYTPSRRTTAMMASTDLSQQRGHRTYAHDDQPASRMGVAQATLAFGSSTRERRSLPGSDSSLSSIRFWTQNTDSHSRYSASILSTASIDRRGGMHNSKTCFNSAVRVPSEQVLLRRPQELWESFTFQELEHNENCNILL
ncbi:hypothetical protein V5799_013597 [Amblyomma americanum]|uniref:Uncharacterized protein n=1 Tax=Amblyomma americanum TaxID=6943 RepID=A0AAQ4E5I0_AMBAM